MLLIESTPESAQANNILLHSLKIKNFLNFEQLKIKAFTQINLITGDNNSGKTHLLKLLYTLAKTWEQYSQPTNQDSFQALLSQKLLKVFQIKQLTELIRQTRLEGAHINLNCAHPELKQHIAFQIGATQQYLRLDAEMTSLLGKAHNVLFLPPLACLTWFEILKALPDYTGFDDIYLDLIQALDAPLDTQQLTQPWIRIRQQFYQLFFDNQPLHIQRQHNQFSLKKANQIIRLPLAAASFKKIALLLVLIQNQKLKPGTILFLEEIETHFHPNMIKNMIELLVDMAIIGGIQIFLTSHNYFVIKQLSLCARRKNISVCCFSLTQPLQGSSQHRTLDFNAGDELTHPITEALLDLFDEEVQLALSTQV